MTPKGSATDQDYSRSFTLTQRYVDGAHYSSQMTTNRTRNPGAPYPRRGPIGAYWHAVRTLLVATVLSFLLTRFVLAPDWVQWVLQQGDARTAMDSGLTRGVFWQFVGVNLDAPLLPALTEYALTRLTFEPMLVAFVACAILSIASAWLQRRR